MRASEALVARGVTRLIHFTQARNLPQIITANALRPRDLLEADEAATFAYSDEERRDRRRDLTSCSIEYGNAYYLAKAQPRARHYPDWIMLELDPVLVDQPGTVVCERNAAAGGHMAASPAAIDRLYGPSILGAGGRHFQRGMLHLPAAPTDLQAEVLVHGAIPLSHVRGVLVATADAGRSIRAMLEQVGCPDLGWRWRVSEVLFDADRLRAHVHDGIVPPEDDLD